MQVCILSIPAMTEENPFIELHKKALHIQQAAAVSVAACEGYLNNPKDYAIDDDVILSSRLEYKSYAASLEKTIDAFPMEAARRAVMSMAILHNIIQGERHLRQLNPELASDITEQMAKETRVFNKTGEYVGTVIRVHEYAAAYDSRYKPTCNVARDVEEPFYAILHAEEQARSRRREEYGNTADSAAQVITCKIIGESRRNFVSVMNRANMDVVTYSDALLNRAVVMDHAARLGYISKVETSMSGHFIKQAMGLAQKVVDTERGLIRTLSATFEMAQATDGDILPGPFMARTYMTAPMPSVFAQLTA